MKLLLDACAVIYLIASQQEQGRKTEADPFLTGDKKLATNQDIKVIVV